MPIQYTIDHQAGFIVETWTGSITIQDLRTYWTTLLADPEVLRLRCTLVDLREAEIAFRGAEMDELVRVLVEPTLHGLDWRTAIVIAHAVHYGLSRQYQVFAERYSHDAIFTDLDEAKAWLLAQ